MNLYFREATGIFGKTLPFVALRLGIGAAMGLFAVLFFGSILWLVSSVFGVGMFSTIGLIALLIAGVVFYGALRLAKRYVFYMIKAAHIAVIAEIVDTGEVPENQISHGKDQVKEQFVEANVLFGIDQAVSGVVRELNDAVLAVQNWLPTTGAMDTIFKILRKSASMAANYIDEAILAFLFVDDEANKWRSARDGVVLYAKCWKPVLTSTIMIVVGMYAATFVLIMALSPVGSLLSNVSELLEALGWIVTLGLVMMLYVGVIKPWVKTVVITTFLRESQDVTPDSDTVDWVEERSDRFAELMERADEQEDVGTTPEEQTGDDGLPGDGTGTPN